MVVPQAVVSNAFERLKRSISDEDAHTFASTELKDVWLAVREIDSSQRKRQSAQNLRRIEPLLQGIEKYTKVIEVLCNGTPYMPYVWAPIKLMLEIASHHRDVFEALLSAYADIGAALPRFDRYQKAFEDNLEFQHVLAAVYAEILEFHQRAYKFFRRRAWHVIFLSLWKDFGARFDSIINSLKKHRDFVDIEATSLDIVEARELRKILQEDIRERRKQELDILEENETNARISRLQHSIAWLSCDEKFQETEYERILNKRHDGTCEWVVNNLNLNSWIKDDARHQSLWLNGKPGSGKTVMCSYIIQTLANMIGLTTCYYFCNSTYAGSVCQEILTIIVLQILRQHPDVCTFIANEFVYRGVSCGMPQLRSLVPQLLELCAYVRIVIDGIDECSEDNQKLILKELQTVCTGPTIRCKVLFSSRREVQLREKFSKEPQIILDECQNVDWDIQSFVKYKILELHTSDKVLLLRIESILVDKANGMFLWARLVIDELKYCYSDAALEETATSLPKGLKAAYGRILDRIMNPKNPRHAKYMAIRILGWMACSYRVLKSYELLDGISLDTLHTALTPKSRVRKEILGLCHPIIEDGPDGTVDFVHFSAKEYILNEEYQAERPFIWRENAHLDITFSCVAFLNSCISLLPEYTTVAQRAAIIVQGLHGMEIYANKFWCTHLLEYCSLLHQQRQFSTELLTQLQLLLRFRKDGNRAPIPTSQARMKEELAEDTKLEALNHWPYIKSLVSDILVFRARIKKEDESEKSFKMMSLESCETDPTNFSTVRHHFQQTVESLLDDKAIINFPGIDKTHIQTFRDTYGTSAFVCRSLTCVFNSDGFESPSQRDKHESKHQRLFRCAYPSCVSFTTGFPTRSRLKRHNETYHAIILEGPSLAESLGKAVEMVAIQQPRPVHFQNNEHMTLIESVRRNLGADSEPRWPGIVIEERQPVPTTASSIQLQSSTDPASSNSQTKSPMAAVSPTPYNFPDEFDGALAHEKNPIYLAPDDYPFPLEYPVEKPFPFTHNSAVAKARTGGDQTPGDTKLPSFYDSSAILGPGDPTNFANNPAAMQNMHQMQQFQQMQFQAQAQAQAQAQVQAQAQAQAQAQPQQAKQQAQQQLMTRKAISGRAHQIYQQQIPQFQAVYPGGIPEDVLTNLRRQCNQTATAQMTQQINAHVHRITAMQQKGMPMQRPQ